MRWTAWLIALCLLAAGVVRPGSLRLTDGHDARIEDGSEIAESLAPRRSSQVTTDKRADRRIDIFTLPLGPSAPSPSRTVVIAGADRPVRTTERSTHARSSRGPPAVAPHVVDHPIS